MNPAKVVRERVKTLTDLPNIGRAMAEDLHLLGIDKPEQLKGCDPYVLYQELSIATSQRQDPCVLDTFISITRFMNGGEALPWWSYTAERKAALQQRPEH
ncbi:MAG TPA: helix-hairpin-helix domain-containing protein [Azonexus sp.]|nr:helix-hairpin-helix domain-containing protein [Azonexus sp.]